MATATAGQRPRISQEFLKANTCERMLAGTARAIAREGYCGATVADCVSAAGTARKTFYDCYGSKEEAALAIVDGVFGFKPEGSASLTALTIEMAALIRTGRKDDARAAFIEAERVLGVLASCEVRKAPPQDDPRRASLPPGRHGLPGDFIRENQLTRLHSGAAAAIVEHGYQATTITKVCESASLSRRTFYENFPSVEKLAVALVVDAVPDEALESLADLPRMAPRSGLAAVAVEVVAERVVKGDPTIGDPPFVAAAFAALAMMASVIGEL